LRERPLDLTRIYPPPPQQKSRLTARVGKVGLVPGVTLAIGFLVLDEAPSLAQLAGLAIVMAGFWLTQRA
jgi:drug/metabolite transporter (DMT)-like permease